MTDTVISVGKKILNGLKKMSGSRVVNPKKAERTGVYDYFPDKLKAEVGVYLKPLINYHLQSITKLTALLLFLLISMPVRSQDKSDLLQRAEQTLAKGDTITALEHFRQVLMVYPQSFAATLRLAEIYYQRKDYDTAVQYANIALDITDNFQIKAEERLQPSRKLAPEKVREEEKKVERYRSDRADVHHLKGLIRLKQLRRNDAVKAFKSALEIKITPQALISLALVYLETGLVHDALKLLHQAKAMAPDSHTPYFNLANVHYKMQNADSAMYYYAVTQEKAPDLKWPYLYKGMIHTQNKEYEKAIAQYTEFIAIDSTHEEAYFRRAVLLSELRQWDAAMEDWRSVLALNPDNAEAWRNKGLSHFQTMQYDSAIAAFNKALVLMPEESYTYINRGYSHYLAGNEDQALADLNTGLQELPEYYLGYYFRALVHLKMHNKKEACSDVRKAIELGMKESEIDEKLMRKCF